MLIEDLDLERGWLYVRNKPALGWRIKTGRGWAIPLIHVNVSRKSQRLVGSKSQRPKWYEYINPPQADCLCGYCGP